MGRKRGIHCVLSNNLIILFKWKNKLKPSSRQTNLKKNRKKYGNNVDRKISQMFFIISFFRTKNIKSTQRVLAKKRVTKYPWLSPNSMKETFRAQCLSSGESSYFSVKPTEPRSRTRQNDERFSLLRDGRKGRRWFEEPRRVRDRHSSARFGVTQYTE